MPLLELLCANSCYKGPAELQSNLVFFLTEKL